MSDPREPQQRCGTCRWWSDPGPGADWGGCDAPIPDCVVDYVRSWTLTDDGRSCPTWESAETESRT